MERKWWKRRTEGTKSKGTEREERGWYEGRGSGKVREGGERERKGYVLRLRHTHGRYREEGRWERE